MGAATAKAGEEAGGAVGSLPGAPPPDWPRLPNEVLALILSWLPPETLATRCRLVCRRWRDLLDGPAVWKLQWRREPAMRAALEAAGRCPRLRWSRLAVLRPLGRNLVRNPCGRGRRSEEEEAARAAETPPDAWLCSRGPFGVSSRAAGPRLALSKAEEASVAC